MRGPTREGGPHVLYRAFDKDGGLLYIGITNEPGERYSAHERSKAWWVDVANIKEERFGSRYELREAERQAINAEYPFYNCMGARYGSCSTCGSRSPRWFPTSADVRGAVTVVLDGQEPFVTCTDPWHWPDAKDKAVAKRVHAGRDRLRELGAIR